MLFSLSGKVVRSIALLAAAVTLARAPAVAGPQAQVLVPGRYADASISVDITLMNPADDQYANLGCRSQGEFSQYRFTIRPTTGQFTLVRWIEGSTAALIPLRSSPAIHRDAGTNRLELSCHGTVLEAFINGTLVASVSDGTFGDGQFWIGMGQVFGLSGSVTPAGSSIEARFTNLVVTQR